jgi:hypothetical protein
VRSTSLLLLALAGCAPRLAGQGAPRRELVQVGEARLVLVSWPEDERSTRQVARALAQAIPPTTRWGALLAPVTITIHPDHAALEEAARRPGYGWLRAWARFGSIELQSPASWGFFRATDAQVVELLTHELTHCVMYQRAATEWSWSLLGIPVWFREGMASVTAGQGSRRGTLEDLRRFYEQEPGGDPLRHPEPLYQARSELVYAAAHHAFAFLLDRFGEARVLESLRRMQGGATFQEAFEEAFGLSEKAFDADFRRHVAATGRPGAGGGQSSSGSLARRTTEATSQSRSP